MSNRTTGHCIKKVVLYPDQGVVGLRHRRAYVAMSLNNKIVESVETLTEVLQWMIDHFQEFVVIVGDYLHRHNVEFLDGATESEAIEASMKRGQRIVEQVGSILNKLGQPQVRILSSAEFYQSANFENRLAELLRLEREVPAFHELTEFTLGVYLNRKGIQVHDQPKARKHSRAYLAEELVIFEQLAEHGYDVSVYPGGQLPVMKALVTGRLPNVSPALEKLTLVEMKFRPVKNAAQ